MMPYEKSKKLSELIKGKRVALVGPSGHLVGQGIGPIINDYDVVCRINYVTTDDKLKNDYGDRADIIFYNCCTLSIDIMREHFENGADVAKNTSLVVCPAIKALGKDRWTEWGPDYVSPVVGNFASINIHDIDFYWVGVKNYRYMFDLIKCPEPNSGTLATLMLLEHEPSELFVTGISFYADRDKVHFDNYREWPKGRVASTPTHWQQPQMRFFRDYILPKNIKIDSYMNEILGTNHNNIQKINRRRHGK